MVISYSVEIEVIMTVAFVVNYLLEWYASADRRRFPFEFYPVVDFFTILPVIEFAVGSDSSPFFRVIRISRSLRILRSFKLIGRSAKPSQKALVEIILMCVCSLFIFATLYEFVETQMYGELTGNYNYSNGDSGPQHVNFGTAVYLGVMVLCTVGYGDIYPATFYGKLFVSILILFSFIVFLTRITTFGNLMKAESMYSVAYKAKKGGRRHVILAGPCINSPNYVIEFVKCFFKQGLNEQKSGSSMRMVILGEGEPDESLLRVILSPALKDAVVYYKGVHSNSENLEACGASHCEAVFVLSDPHLNSDKLSRKGIISHDQQAAENDKKTTLLSFTCLSIAPQANIFVSLSSKDSIQSFPLNLMLKYNTGNTPTGSLKIVESHQVAANVLGMGALIPGFPAIFRQLIGPSEELHNELNGSGSWDKEKKRSSCTSFTIISAPTCMDGHSFTKCVKALWNEYHGDVLLWGVCSFDDEGDRDLKESYAQNFTEDMLSRTWRREVISRACPSGSFNHTSHVIFNPGQDYIIRSGQALILSTVGPKLGSIAKKNHFPGLEPRSPSTPLPLFYGFPPKLEAKVCSWGMNLRNWDSNDECTGESLGVALFAAQRDFLLKEKENLAMKGDSFAMSIAHDLHVIAMEEYETARALETTQPNLIQRALACAGHLLVEGENRPLVYTSEPSPKGPYPRSVLFSIRGRALGLAQYSVAALSLPDSSIPVPPLLRLSDLFASYTLVTGSSVADYTASVRSTQMNRSPRFPFSLEFHASLFKKIFSGYIPIRPGTADPLNLDVGGEKISREHTECLNALRTAALDSETSLHAGDTGGQYRKIGTDFPSDPYDILRRGGLTKGRALWVNLANYLRVKATSAGQLEFKGLYNLGRRAKLFHDSQSPQYFVVEDLCGDDPTQGPPYGHVIIAGPIGESLLLLPTLMRPHFPFSNLQRHIVILTPTVDRVKMVYPKFFQSNSLSIIIGSPSSVHDLQRASISTASSLIILPGAHDRSVRQHETELLHPMTNNPIVQDHPDTEALFQYLDVEKALLGVPTLSCFRLSLKLYTRSYMDLLDSRRCNYLGFSDKIKRRMEDPSPRSPKDSVAISVGSPLIAPLFAGPSSAGKFLTDTMRRLGHFSNRSESTTAISGITYNGHPVINNGVDTIPFEDDELRSTRASKLSTSKNDSLSSASGFIMSDCSLPAQVQAFLNPLCTAVIESLISASVGLGSVLLAEPLPRCYHKKTWGALVSDLFEDSRYRGTLAVGLFRSRHSLGSPSDYVYLSPSSSTVLHSVEGGGEDLVYFLAQQPVWLGRPEHVLVEGLMDMSLSSTYRVASSSRYKCLNSCKSMNSSVLNSPTASSSRSPPNASPATIGKRGNGLKSSSGEHKDISRATSTFPLYHLQGKSTDGSSEEQSSDEIGGNAFDSGSSYGEGNPNVPLNALFSGNGIKRERRGRKKASATSRSGEMMRPRKISKERSVSTEREAWHNPYPNPSVSIAPPSTSLYVGELLAMHSDPPVKRPSVPRLQELGLTPAPKTQDIVWSGSEDEGGASKVRNRQSLQPRPQQSRAPNKSSPVSSIAAASDDGGLIPPPPQKLPSPYLRTSSSPLRLSAARRVSGKRIELQGLSKELSGSRPYSYLPFEIELSEMGVTELKMKQQAITAALLRKELARGNQEPVERNP